MYNSTLRSNKTKPKKYRHTSFLLCFTLLSCADTEVFINLRSGPSLVAQMVKNLPAVQKTQVQPVGWEDPLEKGMAAQSSILALRALMVRGAWWAAVYGVTHT